MSRIKIWIFVIGLVLLLNAWAADIPEPLTGQALSSMRKRYPTYPMMLDNMEYLVPPLHGTMESCACYAVVEVLEDFIQGDLHYYSVKVHEVLWRNWVYPVTSIYRVKTRPIQNGKIYRMAVEVEWDYFRNFLTQVPGGQLIMPLTWGKINSPYEGYLYPYGGRNFYVTQDDHVLSTLSRYEEETRGADQEELDYNGLTLNQFKKELNRQTLNAYAEAIHVKWFYVSNGIQWN
jgi:hypothetical protein